MAEKNLAIPDNIRIFMDKLKGYGIITIHKFKQIWQ